MAKFHQLIRKASSLFNLSVSRVGKQFEDGEIIYSKNNVCVHLTDNQTDEIHHYPGYLTIKVQIRPDKTNAQLYFSYILSWIPNITLWRNPKSIKYGTLEDSSCSETVPTEKELNKFDFQKINSIIDISFNPRNFAVHFDNNCDQPDLSCDKNILLLNNSMINSSSQKGDKNFIQTKQSMPNEEGQNRLSSIPSGGEHLPLLDEVNLGSYSRRQSDELLDIINVDLKQMKSLRLFFSDNQLSNGQLILVNYQSQYKIFHFHNGGLDKLADVLNDFDFVATPKKEAEESKCQLFSICRPQISAEECHPDENVYEPVNKVAWENYQNEFGQIDDSQNLRKNVFFAGIDQKLRKEVWPFLLGRFDFCSSNEERTESVKNKAIEYELINQKKEMFNNEDTDRFWKNIECTIEKDVVRTDRSNRFFAGDNNANIEKMKRILLNFASYCPTIGYTQGMSDLLAPILVELDNESEAFWCFVAMMQNTNFVCPPRDSDVDSNLFLLRELLRLLNPKFYNHIRRTEDALEMLFVHRWILLCFKREFPENDALKIWEICWSKYQTEYFHLFVCLAVISLYGDDIVRYQMTSDEILFHFSTLSMNMNGSIVQRKSRGLFHQFLMLPKIPCTLKKLRNFSENNLQLWDSCQEQIIECVKEDQRFAKLCHCSQ